MKREGERPAAPLARASAALGRGRRPASSLGILARRGRHVDKAIQELTLPLRHEDIIRQQAAEKGVDASLIAAVIYSESRFSDQTSSAGPAA